ncbi:hypothetical protein [uncultured Roseobacter sp.]|uniref:hypothetical protein n=1 Tax=uncultured Roseobacter sp. TaxID=114847 RepID=UPI00261F22E2|nr:hypothetical protein [uncultured Roseobacter sp.]
MIIIDLAVLAAVIKVSTGGIDHESQVITVPFQLGKAEVTSKRRVQDIVDLAKFAKL